MKFVGDQLKKVLNLIGLSSESVEAETNERTSNSKSPNVCQFRE